MAEHAPIFDSWDLVVRNRGYRPDVVRRVNAERRARDRAQAVAARKAARQAEKAAFLEKVRLGLLADRDAVQAKLVKARSSGTKFAQIEALACIVFDVLPAELRGKSRTQKIVFARQFVSYWACRRTSLSLPQIGKLMGGKDHTTILHGAKAYVAKRRAMKPPRFLRPAR